MADVNTLVDVIDTRFQTSGAAEATASLDKVAGAHGAVEAASDKSTKATISAEAALSRLQSKYDQEYRAKTQLEKAETTLTRAREQGLISREREIELMALAEKGLLKEAESENVLAAARERLNKVSEFGAGLTGGVGGIAGLLGLGAVVELGNAIKETTKQAEELDAASKRIGMNTDQLQELGFAAKTLNVDFGEMVAGMDKFNVAIGQASRGAGTLAPILKANGITLKDSNGNQKSTNELLYEYADLVKNAKNEQDQALLVRLAFGRAGSKETELLAGGSAALKDYADKAHQLGAVQKDELIKNTAELDKVFNQYTSAVQTALTGVLYEFLNWLKSVTGEMTSQEDILQRVKNMAGGLVAGGAVGLAAGGPIGGVIGAGVGVYAGANTPIIQTNKNFVPGGVGAQGGAMIDPTAGQPFRYPADTAGSIGPAGTDTGSFDWAGFKKFADPKTIIPGTKTGPDAFQQAETAIKKQTDALKVQADTFGMTGEALARYTKQQDLLNVAAEHNIKLSPEQKAEVDKLADSYAKAVTVIEHMKAVQEAVNFLAQDAYDAFMSWINGTDSLAHAMQNLAKQILEAALQAELLGQGPLANLFGTGGGAGGLIQGGIKAIMGMFGGGMAGGGPLDSGKWYIAGEHGPEPIWGGGPGAAAMGYGGGGGNGGGGGVQVNVINQTDASVSVQDRGEGAGGQRKLEIMVRNIVGHDIASGFHDKALQSRGAGGRQPAKYG